jgi:hypothetical protein
MKEYGQTNEFEMEEAGGSIDRRRRGMEKIKTWTGNPETFWIPDAGF